VQAQDLTALLIGDSDGLEVGDFVLAIGSPYRIGQTVTSGIISGLHRTNVGMENTRISSKPMQHLSGKFGRSAG